MTLGQKRQFLNRKLNEIPTNSTLQFWLDQAEAIGPEMAEAISGIYCGTEGTIHVGLSGFYDKLWLKMGWHQVHPEAPVRVEYAYVS